MITIVYILECTMLESSHRLRPLLHALALLLFLIEFNVFWLLLLMMFPKWVLQCHDDFVQKKPAVLKLYLVFGDVHEKGLTCGGTILAICDVSILSMSDNSSLLPTLHTMLFDVVLHPTIERNILFFVGTPTFLLTCSKTNSILWIDYSVWGFFTLFWNNILDTFIQIYIPVMSEQVLEPLFIQIRSEFSRMFIKKTPQFLLEDTS